jgi:formiminoglutamase
MNTPDMTLWQGRIDNADGELGQRWHQIVQAYDETTPSAPAIALLGFACDAGVARNHGRIGARQGPTALRQALSNLPAQVDQCIVDAGNIECDADALEVAQQRYAQRITHLLEQNLFPIGLGGGHEIAYGTFQGLANHLSAKAQPKVGIINLDAHFDLRADEKASSGTPFRQIAQDCAKRGWDFNYCCLGVSEFSNTQALFKRASDLNVTWRRDEDMSIRHIDETLAILNTFINRVDTLYLTLCLDVLPAAIVPGVSAPAAHGVPIEVIETLVDAVCHSGKLKVFDIAELNPSFDVDNRSARVGARMVARVAKHMMANPHDHDL